MVATVLGAATLYDQVNVTSFAPFELLARRYALIVGAHSRDASNPMYSGTEFYTGEADEDGIAPGLQRNVAVDIKNKAMIVDAYNKSAELKVRLPKPPKVNKGKGEGEGDG